MSEKEKVDKFKGNYAVEPAEKNVGLPEGIDPDYVISRLEFAAGYGQETVEQCAKRILGVENATEENIKKVCDYITNYINNSNKVWGINSDGTIKRNYDDPMKTHNPKTENQLMGPVEGSVIDVYKKILDDAFSGHKINIEVLIKAAERLNEERENRSKENWVNTFKKIFRENITENNMANSRIKFEKEGTIEAFKDYFDEDTLNKYGFLVVEAFNCICEEIEAEKTSR